MAVSDVLVTESVAVGLTVLHLEITRKHINRALCHEHSCGTLSLWQIRTGGTDI
jgi:hypothetical protein